MNILFVSEIFPDADSPSRGAFNYELCRALGRDHDVRVIAPRAWKQAIPTLLSGRRYRTRTNPDGPDVRATYPVYWYPPCVLRHRYGDFMWKSVNCSLQQLSRDFTPDVVLSYWAHPDGEAGLRAARRFNVPAAVIVGGSDVLILPNCPKRGERIRHVLGRSDAVITISEGLRESVIDLGISPARVHTLEQGINPRLFSPGDRRAAREALALPAPLSSDDHAMLLWVGRMVDVKRLDVLVAAADELRQRGRQFVLCLAGDGPLRERITQFVHNRRLDEFIHFAGSLPPEALGDWYRAADVTVLSSQSEGLPNVLRESLACGTPFVATDVGSISEIADDGYSALVAAGDATSLADGVERVLNGRHREHALCYEPRTWDAMATDVSSLLGDLRRGRHATREPAVCPVG